MLEGIGTRADVAPSANGFACRRRELRLSPEGLRHGVLGRKWAVMAKRKRVLVGLAVVTLVAGVAAHPAGIDARHDPTTVVHYDASSLDEYGAMWSNSFGPGELAVGGTRDVRRNSAVTVSAVPFKTSADFSVFDHLKYIAISSSSFAVPESGSLEFSVDITATTPGTQAGRVIHGCYGPPGSWDGVAPCARPWSQTARQGQQAGVVLNMVDFQSGQLFDWFVSGDRVFALIERLPTVVTGSPGVGLDQAYTQIIKEAPVKPGRKHEVAIRYTRRGDESFVEYFLDNKLFTRVDNVGVPLDVQGVPYTGYAPALGAGEELSIDSFSIRHGLFSLLDAFPYQHPDTPELSVSIPLEQRLFGQGATGTWKHFTVTTRPD